ncbi:MAG: DUF4925 domain-containing protein [Muribaculaceae bacterium]|nr:DUF4925 domain-containing protein [Muribaculaceae bacterium]
MKKQFALAVALVGAVSMFTSCSDDKDEPVIPGSSLEAKTYTAAEGLTLTVDDAVTPGQTVSFTPASDGTATITLKGEALDITSLIPDMTARATAPALSFPTSCVLPGSAEASFTVTLAGDADKATFSGSSDTEYCTFAYSGEVSNEAMTLKLSDIKLKNTSMAGTYSTHAFEENIFNVLRAYWVSENKIEIFGPGTGMDVNAIINMSFALAQIQFGENTLPIPAIVPEVLKNVTLGEDGSVIAKYADTAVDGMPITESPKGLARYVVKDDNTLLLFLDPQTIIANTMKMASKSRAIDINALLEGLMTNVVPMLANGVPVNYGARISTLDLESDGTYTPVYDTDENAVSFYLGTEVLLPILKTLSPLLTDDEVIQAIVDAASQDPNMGSLAGMLPGILKSIPAVIEGTSTIEIGINLYK